MDSVVLALVLRIDAEKGRGVGVLHSLGVQYLMNETSMIISLLITSYTEFCFLLSNHPILILHFLIQFMYFCCPHFYLLSSCFFTPSSLVPFLFTNPRCFICFQFCFALLFTTLGPEFSRFFCANTALMLPLPSAPGTQTGDSGKDFVIHKSFRLSPTRAIWAQSIVFPGKRELQKALSWINVRQ